MAVLTTAPGEVAPVVHVHPRVPMRARVQLRADVASRP